ncbi:MAG: hypothetical protein AB8V23_01700 [Candidatus Midichloria sp.]|nr:hypothetical protein MHYMCMPSP_00838 [Hyalomma marginatum]
MIGVIISIIFGIVIASIAVLITINLVLNSSNRKKSKEKLQTVLDSSPYRKHEPLPKLNTEFLHRDEEQERAQENEVTKYNDLEVENDKQKSETKIVGIVEPQGFWSNFIISQKLGYIISRMAAQQSGKGFWVNLIKAQSMSQGKNQSRGR